MTVCSLPDPVFICKLIPIFVSVCAGQSPKDTEHIFNQVLQSHTITASVYNSDLLLGGGSSSRIR